MIRGYPREPSVFPGDDLQICVATTANQFWVEFYHQGEHLETPQTLPKQGGPMFPPKGAHADPDSPAPAPGGSLGGDWGWQGYSFTIPDDWSGVYVAILSEEQPNPPQFDANKLAFGIDSKLLFVVKRKQAAAPFLYKLPLLTYHAYNYTGETSLYSAPAYQDKDYRSWISIRRPGGGTGGKPFFVRWPSDSSYDPFDPRSPNQNYTSLRNYFSHWDELFISWLAMNN